MFLYVNLPYSRPMLEAVLRQLLTRAGVVAPRRLTDAALAEAGVTYVLTEEWSKSRVKVELTHVLRGS